MAHVTLLSKHINEISTFSDMYTVTKSFTNKEKGDIFEELVKYIFIYHHVYRTFTNKVWIFNEIPQNLLKKLNMPSKDQGIDLVLLDIYGKYHAIQCKFRSDSDKIINWTTVSTFYGLAFGIAQGFSGGFYVTNTIEITENAKKSKNVVPVYGDFFDDIPKSFFDELKSTFVPTTQFKINVAVPRLHQSCAIEQLSKHFKKNNRGYLSMICGSGKTLTAYWFNKMINSNLTIVTVPSLYLLSQFYSDWAKQSIAEKCNYNFILVGSDADIGDVKFDNNGLILTTNSTEISYNIKSLKCNDENKCKIVIITTYQSSNKVIGALNTLKLNPDLCIFDEAHKTVGQVTKQFSLLLDDKNIKIKNRLFMTATPKIFTGDIDKENVLSMDDEKWYGKLVYKYSASDAIKDGYLSDYQIITMFTNNKYIEETIEKNKYVWYNSNIMDSHYMSTAIMLLNSFKKKECHHLVTYHNSIASSKKFKCILDKMLDSYGLKISILNIDGTNIMSQRKKIIKEFIDADMAILVSAKVLNEGIDIPIIDSICFVDSRSSTIDIIQCIGRALRLHNKKEIAKIYVPIMVNDIKNVDENKTLGNIIRILQCLSETDSNINEYFGAIENGSIVNKQLVKNVNNISTEKFGAKINIDKWINNIGIKIWNKISGKTETDSHDTETVKYNCDSCKFHTDKKTDYTRHVNSKKHIEKMNQNTNNISNVYVDKKSVYMCDYCENVFSTSSSLARHKKACDKYHYILKKHNDNDIEIERLQRQVKIYEQLLRSFTEL